MFGEPTETSSITYLSGTTKERGTRWIYNYHLSDSKSTFVPVPLIGDLFSSNKSEWKYKILTIDFDKIVK